MKFSYTRLGVLLLRIQSIIMILNSVSSVSMSYFFEIQRRTLDERFRPEGQFLISLIYPVIGILIYLFAVPLAQRAVGFLDAGGSEKEKIENENGA